MLEWLGQLNEEERILAIRDAFAQMAKSQPGAIVFAVLFEQLYFFRPCLDANSQTLANFAKHLLNYFGDDVQLKIMEAVVGNAQHVSPMPPERKEDA